MLRAYYALSAMPEFQPSKLGTRQHWDEVYGEEIENFDELREEGEIWYVLYCSLKKEPNTRLQVWRGQYGKDGEFTLDGLPSNQ